MKKQLGTGEIINEDNKNGFTGTERKVWLYVYRVKLHVTAEMVKEHIKKQPNFDNEKVEVKELPSKSDHQKSFVVTAPLRRKDEMYAVL